MSNKEKFYLSFSAIETFNTCQRKYYYNYLLKLPKKFWPWLTFGNFNHLVLEKFHNYIMFFKKKNRSYDKKALMKRAFYSSIRKSSRLANSGKAASMTREQFEASKLLLQKYYRRIEANEPNVLFTEKYFELDLGDDIILRGFIDRIDQVTEKQFKIVDYKTSKEAYAIDKNDQLAIYAIGLRQSLDAEDIEIYKQLDFLKVGKIMPKAEEGQLHDQSTDRALLDKLLKIGQTMRDKVSTDKNENEWQWKENSFCFCCDFKQQCFASRGQDQNISINNDFEFA